MLRISLFVVIVLSLSGYSCKSVEKLVDQGRYDKALTVAVRKLSGKKNKKTKHVMAM